MKKIWLISITFFSLVLVLVESTSAVNAITPSYGQISFDGGGGTYASISCPTNNSCTALAANGGNPDAWEGNNNKWNSGTEFDLTSEPNTKSVVDSKKLQYFLPSALTCTSPGNCEGLVVGESMSRFKVHHHYDSYIKPVYLSTFLISEVSSVWQSPVHIKELDMVQNTVPVHMIDKNSIYCISHGNCVIAGNSGGPSDSTPDVQVRGSENLNSKPYFITEVNGIWSKPQFPMNEKLQNRGAHFYDVVCTSLSNCLLRGGYLPSHAVISKLISLNQPVEINTLLGFSLSLKNGKWGEPIINLGPVFKKGPYPHGDPILYTSNYPGSFFYGSTKNAMPCILAENCEFGDLISHKIPDAPLATGSSPSGQIQPAGIGDAKWPAKCPAVIDSVGGAQPKISGYKFDGSGGENFMRLVDGGSTAVTTPGNVVGCYADIASLNGPQANGYHIGTISRDATGYYWQNAAGVRWGLTLSGSILVTDKSNPYYDKGHNFITY